MGLLNGLDLFSGIGGIGFALRPWVRTVTYCEIERYAQGVLLSRMQSGDIDTAPIWDDVRTLKGEMLPPIDIIYGGFPCQDISCAGRGEGLGGQRSGLFFEIIRLIEEVRPAFVFLENVPAIRTRGLDRVCFELAARGYDLRWTSLSAASVGAPHLRKRWFLLAHAHGSELRIQSRGGGGEIGEDSLLPGINGPKQPLACRKRWETVGDPNIEWNKPEPRSVEQEGGEGEPFKATRLNHSSKALADPLCEGLEGLPEPEISAGLGQVQACPPSVFDQSHWSVEPNVDRVVNGLPFRVDRIRGLGNAVVPAQAREAFERLMGL